MLRTGTTSKWHQVWKDGLQLAIPGIAVTHLQILAVATWLKWRLITDVTTKDFKVAVVATEEIFREMEEIAI